MRVLSVIALFGFAIVGMAPASAADFPAAHSGVYPVCYVECGRPSGMLWFYDDEPGVVVRAYWREPWRHHHYFPATGLQPKYGRYENLSAHRAPPVPAKSYRRTWSNASALARERYLHVPPADDRPMPRFLPMPQNPE